MADKVSATISYVDANNRKGMKAVTDINPGADNIAVKNFCTGLNALTTNTLSGIEKIERTDITNAPTVKPDLEVTLANVELMRQRLRLGGKSENTDSHFLQFLVMNPEVYPVKVNFQKVNNTSQTGITKIDWTPIYMPGLPAAGYVHGIWDLTAFEGATGNIEMTLTFAETSKTKETKYKVTVTANAPVLEKITE